MSAFSTRRKFFERANLAVSGFLLTRSLPIEKAMATKELASELVDYYDKLGVTKRINAAGTYTYLTGSLMPA